MPQVSLYSIALLDRMNGVDGVDPLLGAQVEVTEADVFWTVLDVTAEDE